MLVGQDDVHIVNDGGAGVLPVAGLGRHLDAHQARPGAAYRAWEQRIAAAQSKAPGFQGYRFEPPVPGVQDDWLAILRFDTEANLQAWLELAGASEAAEGGEALHRGISRPHRPHRLRPVVPGPAGGAPPPAAWKMNMLVLLMLYPVVFLFGLFVQTPFLTGRGPAVRDRPVHRQHRERRAAELSRAMDEPTASPGGCSRRVRTRGASRLPERRSWSRSTA